MYFMFQNLDPAIMEFTVKSSLVIEPDGVYMLEGARVPMKLVESVKTKEGPIKKGKSVCEGERERGREGERECRCSWWSQSRQEKDLLRKVSIFQ